MSDIINETISYEEARLQILENERDEIRNLVWRPRGIQSCDMISREDILKNFENCEVKEVTSSEDVMLIEPEKEIMTLEATEFLEDKNRALEKERDLLEYKLAERSDILRDKDIELEEYRVLLEKANRTVWQKIMDWLGF